MQSPNLLAKNSTASPIDSAFLRARASAISERDGLPRGSARYRVDLDFRGDRQSLVSSLVCVRFRISG